MKVNVKVNGYNQLKFAASSLQDQIERGAMRESITKAARLVTAAAKRNAPKGATGLLKKSIRQKVTTTARKAVLVLIGPSKRVTGQYDLAGTGNIITVRPVNYAHLVEMGSATRGSYGRKGVKVSASSRPQPFMRPAFESTKFVAMAQYKAGMVPAIQNAARRIKKRTLKNLT